MNLQDATEIVIDTSDSEERELLEAQKPGYYERVWGYSKVLAYAHRVITTAFI